MLHRDEPARRFTREGDFGTGVRARVRRGVRDRRRVFGQGHRPRRRSRPGELRPASPHHVLRELHLRRHPMGVRAGPELHAGGRRLRRRSDSPCRRRMQHVHVLEWAMAVHRPRVRDALVQPGRRTRRGRRLQRLRVRRQRHLGLLPEGLPAAPDPRRVHDGRLRRSHGTSLPRRAILRVLRRRILRRRRSVVSLPTQAGQLHRAKRSGVRLRSENLRERLPRRAGRLRRLRHRPLRIAGTVAVRPERSARSRTGRRRRVPVQRHPR